MTACGNRHGNLACQRSRGHEGTHRAETGPPQTVERPDKNGTPTTVTEAQVQTWH